MSVSAGENSSYRRLGFLLFPCVALALLALTCSAYADGPPLAVDEYWRRLEATRTLVAASRAAQDVDREELRTAADEWLQVTRIVLPDGTEIAVDHSYLGAMLGADDPDVILLERLLTALLSIRDTWSQSAEYSYDPGALALILSRPEFKWESERPAWLQDLLARLLEWALKWQAAVARVVGQPISRYVLTLLGVLVLAVVLSYTLRGLMADLVSDAEIDEGEHEGDVPLTAASALRRAQGLSKGQDYRSAVRYLYLSAILALEERGLLRYDRSQTNREYLRSVSHLPRLVGLLRGVVDVFERVWYGFRQIDQETYERYEEQVRNLGREK